jgi:hypothetical protein
MIVAIAKTVAEQLMREIMNMTANFVATTRQVRAALTFGTDSRACIQLER